MKAFQIEAAYRDSGFSLWDVSSGPLLPCAFCWEDSPSHPVSLAPILVLLPDCVQLKGNSSPLLKSAISNPFAGTTVFCFVFVQHLGPF